jgi:hypothetical protein
VYKSARRETRRVARKQRKQRVADGKHAQRHSLHVQAALINGGMPAMEKAQAERATCERCKLAAVAE